MERCIMKRDGLSGLIVCAALILPSLAFAQDPTKDTGGGPARVFGDTNQIAISSDAALEIQHSSQRVTTISFSPAADFFIAKNISVGGALLFEYDKAGSSDATRFGIGPRVGYNYAFTDMLGIWPKIGFSYSHTSRSTDTAAGPGTTLTLSRSGNAFTLNLFAPVMFHPVPHFFVGFGPFLDTDLGGSDKVTTYGLKLTIGGWFDY
jgi:hypothetical protein